MLALADRPFKDLLEDVAAERAAPGGGCSAAWSCALAAGLVEMSAAFTVAQPRYAERHPRMTEIQARAHDLRARVMVIAEEELHAYEPVLDALRLPADDPGRPERLDAALSAAARSPLAVAQAAAEVAELAAEAARTGNLHLQGDAVTGALLAEAACRAAARLVEINLARRPGDGRHQQIAELVSRASAARDGALS
jgi:formiminotetrahydrofolate cyclodeaminase